MSRLGQLGPLYWTSDLWADVSFVPGDSWFSWGSLFCTQHWSHQHTWYVSISTEFQNELKHVQQVLQRLGPGERDTLGYGLYSTQSGSRTCCFKRENIPLTGGPGGPGKPGRPCKPEKKQINNAVIILNQNPDWVVTHSLSYGSSGAHWTRRALQTATTQSHTDRTGRYKGCVSGGLLEVLEDQPGLFVQEDRSLLPPLCCPRKQTQKEWSCLISLSCIFWHLSALLLGDTVALAVNN